MKPPEQVISATIGTEGPTTATIELVYIPGHFRVRCSDAESGHVFVEGFGLTPEQAIREADEGWRK